MIAHAHLIPPTLSVLGLLLALVIGPTAGAALYVTGHPYTDETETR